MPTRFSRVQQVRAKIAFQHHPHAYINRNHETLIMTHLRPQRNLFIICFTLLPIQRLLPCITSHLYAGDDGWWMWDQEWEGEICLCVWVFCYTRSGAKLVDDVGCLRETAVTDDRFRGGRYKQLYVLHYLRCFVQMIHNLAEL